MASTTKQTKEQVIDAIRDSGGIKTDIARSLGVTRLTVDHYLKRWPTVQQAYDEEVATVGDIAERVIIKTLKSDDVSRLDAQLETSKWYARVKLKDRGYADSVNVRHSGDEEKPVVVKHVGAADLLAAELAFLRSIGVKPKRLGLVEGDHNPPDAGADSLHSEGLSS